MSPTAARRKARPKSAKAPEPERPFVAHRLVPPHEILSEQESRATLATLGTSLERLPRILLSDPGLRTDPQYQGLKEAKEPLAGRLVRVRRPSPTAGEAIAYRVLSTTSGGD